MSRLTFILLLWLAGLPALRAKPVEIEIPIFTGGPGISFFAQTARAYEAAHPGVRVNLYGDPRISDELRIRLMEGSYPDATDSSLPWHDLVRDGEIVDLAPYLNEAAYDGTSSWRDTFVPGALSHWASSGHVYALPLQYAVHVVFYNKKLFRDQGWNIPKTWDEWFALCDRMKARGVAPLAFPGVYLYYADTFLKSAYYNLAGPDGYQAYLDLAPGARSDPRFKRAAAILQRLAADDFQPGWQGTTHTAAQAEFFGGRTAMMVNGSWMVSEMQGKIPADFELGAFDLPVFADGIGSPTAMDVGSEYYFVFAHRPHVRETVDFLKFLTSPATATAFTRTTDTPTATRGVDAANYSPAMRDVAALIAQSTASFGDAPGASPPHPEMEQAFNDARFELMTGKITPDQFGDRLEAAAAAERELAADPAHIESRHPVATSILLLVLAMAIAAVCATQFRDARSAAARPAQAPAARMPWRAAAIFILPSLLLYALFVIKPSAEAFAWSLREWDGVTAPHYVGLLNFKRLLLESDSFWQAMKNNLFLMVVPPLFVLPLALFFAALISRGIWGSKVYRVCFFFPNILGSIAVTLLWLNAYDPAGGLVNGALIGLGRAFQALRLDFLASWFLSFKDFAWLSQDHLYWSLVPMAIWGGCGFNMILYLAAMESIDESYYEAARIDGASALRQFFHITLPLIWDVLVVTVVFAFIGGLKAFESIWLLTSQQPTSQTHVIGTLMVSKLFNDFRVGEATAIAVLLFGLVFFATVALLRLTRRENDAAG